MVYQRKIRMEGDATFEAFDCPDGGQVCPKRTRSITALQALNLLNSHFMVQQADLFSQRLLQETNQKILRGLFGRATITIIKNYLDSTIFKRLKTTFFQ